MVVPVIHVFTFTTTWRYIFFTVMKTFLFKIFKGFTDITANKREKFIQGYKYDG
jgi:hypothetical protein